MLASWLLAAADRPVVLARQAAVGELAAMDDWREQLGAHGELAPRPVRSEIDAFLTWAEGPGWSSNFASRSSAVFTRRFFLAHLSCRPGADRLHLDSPLAISPRRHRRGTVVDLMVAGVVVSFAYVGRIHRAFNRAGAGQHALLAIRGALRTCVDGQVRVAAARTLHDRLSADGKSAPACMRRLNRILGCAELRSGAGIFHFLMQALTLWDFHVLFALERWRQAAGRHVRGWLDAVGEIDALSPLARGAPRQSRNGPCRELETTTDALVAEAFSVIR